jgi:hypothetical protein
VKFEFDWETNSNSISNLSPKLNSLICKMSSLCYGPYPSLPCFAAAQPKPPSRPTSPRHRSLFLSLSPTCGPRLAVTVSPHLLSLSFLLCLTPCVGQPSRPPRRAAGPAMPGRGTGCGRTPTGTHAEGRYTPTQLGAPEEKRGRADLPRPRASKALRAVALARHLPRSAAVPRALRDFPPRAAATPFQKEREPVPGGKANRPHLGFLLPP